MSADRIEIRRLVQTDAVLYRGIRLKALQANPEAFGVLSWSKMHNL